MSSPLKRNTPKKKNSLPPIGDTPERPSLGAGLMADAAKRMAAKNDEYEGKGTHEEGKGTGSEMEDNVTTPKYPSSGPNSVASSTAADSSYLDSVKVSGDIGPPLRSRALSDAASRRGSRSGNNQDTITASSQSTAAGGGGGGVQPRQRDSLIDQTVWLSAMGELSGESLKKNSRKLSVAALNLPGKGDGGDNEQGAPATQTQVESLLSKIFGQNDGEESEEFIDRVAFMPDDRFRQRWDMFMILCVVYNCLMIPLRMAFGNDGVDGFAYVDWVVDALFMIDIVINFNTAVDDDGILIVDKKRVRSRYLKTWFGFDLLISLPIDLPFYFIGGNSDTRLYFRIPRLLRLLRIPRALRYLSRWDDKVAIDGAAFRMGKLIFMILMYAHTNACLQFFISRLMDFPEDGWVARSGILDDSEAKQYTVALFNALSHMLCIGYGQHTQPSNPLEPQLAFSSGIDPPAPVLTPEIWITIISMVTGASFFVILVGLMSSLMLSMDRAGALYSHKVNVWKQYFKYRRLPKEIRERVMKYYEFRWFTRKVFDEEELLDELPYCLKQDVHGHICKYLLERIPIFTLCQKPVSRSLVTHLKPLGCLADDFIYIYGQVAEEMYFIVKGEVELIKGDGFVAAELSDGSYFGEAPLLASDICIRTASARAKTYTNIYSLSSDDFYDIAAVYPEARNLLKQFALAGSESRTGDKEMGLDVDF